MVLYYEGIIAKEIAKTLAKRGKFKRTGGKDGDLKKDREPRTTYPTPLKSDLKSRSRERQKAKKKQERAEGQGPKEHRLLGSASMRHARKREKEILEGRPQASAWSFDGTIEEVKEGYVVVRSAGGETRKTFMIDETTKDFNKKQGISLGDLELRMKIRVRYKMSDGKMVAIWIKY